MKEKYIKFFKKELVFLLILLIVICFSFGVTYSNFVYNEENHRAVEMFTGALKYEIDNNKISVLPGNNLVNIKIKSLNEISSLYKLVYKNDNVVIKYFNKDNKNSIKGNETITLTLDIYNKSNTNEVVTFDVVGGYIINSIDDIKVGNDFKEVYGNINVGDVFAIGDFSYRLLDIDKNGNFELISDPIIEVTVSGSKGYNTCVNVLKESLPLMSEAKSIKAVSINDIRKHTVNDFVSYDNAKTYRNAYYPTLWTYEESSIVNGYKNEAKINKSGTFDVVDDNNYASSITVDSIVIGKPEFISPVYESIFMDSDYLVSTRYSYNETDKSTWGMLSIKDNNISKEILYDTNNETYEVHSKYRFIIKINTNLLFSEI